MSEPSDNIINELIQNGDDPDGEIEWLTRIEWFFAIGLDPIGEKWSKVRFFFFFFGSEKEQGFNGFFFFWEIKGTTNFVVTEKGLSHKWCEKTLMLLSNQQF